MGEVGDTILGMAAKDHHSFYLSDPEALKKALYRRLFQEYTLLIRASMQQSSNYPDSIRYNVSKVLPESPTDNNKELLNKLKLYKNK